MSQGTSTSTPDPLLAAFANAVRAKIRRDLDAEAALAAKLSGALLPRVRELVAEARAAGLVRAAWVFGSYAWGRPTERSDLDLLVDAEARAAVDELAWRVTEALGLPVDAWWLDTAPSALVERARAEGIAL